MAVSSSVKDREPGASGAAGDPGVTRPATVWLQAIVHRDPALLAAALAPAAAMRALIPPGLREASGVAQVASLVLGWFADASAVDVREADAAIIGPRTRLRYRLRITEGDQVYDAEQVAYFTLSAGQIVAADLICSGCHPVAAAQDPAG